MVRHSLDQGQILRHRSPQLGADTAYRRAASSALTVRCHIAVHRVSHRISPCVVALAVLRGGRRERARGGQGFGCGFRRRRRASGRQSTSDAVLAVFGYELRRSVLRRRQYRHVQHSRSSRSHDSASAIDHEGEVPGLQVCASCSAHTRRHAHRSVDRSPRTWPLTTSSRTPDFGSSLKHLLRSGSCAMSASAPGSRGLPGPKTMTKLPIYLLRGSRLP